MFVKQPTVQDYYLKRVNTYTFSFYKDVTVRKLSRGSSQHSSVLITSAVPVVISIYATAHTRLLTSFALHQCEIYESAINTKLKQKVPIFSF